MDSLQTAATGIFFWSSFFGAANVTSDINDEGFFFTRGETDE